MADIEESSGLSASECQDVLWTHNDAGNDALIFGMSTEGKHLGTWQVEGADNVDWESIATYKDPAGKCFLTIGDIGDNDEARDELDIYRIAEPTMTAETAASDSVNPILTEAAQSMRFSYPDGNNNAETILVHPKTGDIYVVTKKESGPAAVFRIKPAFGAGTAVMSEKVADISVASDPEGRLTGGSISPDGNRVMLCDLNAGYEFVLPEGAADPDAIWQQQPLPVDLGDRPQGEGVSYGRDGTTLFASSEEKNSPLFLIRRR
jgi:DNA-binding beta-propeller fold protein YncE